MNKSNILFIIFFALTQISLAQMPTLVTDYAPGDNSSIDGRVRLFQNTLTYQGYNEVGESVILQYDKDTDEVSVLATNEDFDGEINSITSNSIEMVVFTREENAGFVTINMYRAFESDFSDITKIYSSDNIDLLTFRFHQDHYLLVEAYNENGEDKTNFKVLDAEGNVDDFLLNLNGRFFDFQYTSVNGHFILAPELDYIDGKSVFAYSLDAKSEVPFTDIVPGFQDCGVMSRLRTLNNNLVYYDCEGTFIYDISREEFIFTDNISYFVFYDRPDDMFVNFDGGIYKLDKNNGQLELVVDSYASIRPFGSKLLYTSTGLIGFDINLLDFESEEVLNFYSNLPDNANHTFTGLAEVPEGFHFIVIDTDTDNGTLSRINENGYVELDDVYNVNFLSFPVAYDEDIYYTHQDPEFGFELFKIDYELSSLIEIAKEHSIGISPIPASDYIEINYTSNARPQTLQVVDQRGQIVKNSKDLTKIDVSQFDSGMYFLVAVFEDGNLKASKFIKE